MRRGCLCQNRKWKTGFVGIMGRKLARETSLTMMVVTSTGLGEWTPGQASRTGDSSICVKLVGSCQKPASIASQIFPLSQNLSWHLTMICSVSHKNFLSNSLTCLYSDSSVNFTSERAQSSFKTCSMSKLTLENPCLYFSLYVGSNLDWTAQTKGTHVAA